MKSVPNLATRKKWSVHESESKSEYSMAGKRESSDRCHVLGCIAKHKHEIQSKAD